MRGTFECSLVLLIKLMHVSGKFFFKKYGSTKYKSCKLFQNSLYFNRTYNSRDMPFVFNIFWKILKSPQ